eukprot:scaffold3725_cov114-Cylindrotheca_fusiformis.AAC.4
MVKLDIQREIALNATKCEGLLERFRSGNVGGQEIVDATDGDDGNSPLHEVMRSCQGDNVLELVEYLVEAHPEGVEAEDASGNLPIHIMPRFASPTNKKSIQRDQLLARKFLMEKYPDGVRQRNKRGETPLAKAIFLDYNIFVTSMVTDNPTLLTEPDKDGKLPLHYAIESWNEEMVKILIQMYPEGISSIEALPPGDEDDRQTILSAIAEGSPQSFEIHCSCGKDDGECVCKPPTILIRKFFAEAKFQKWGQDIMWSLMKGSMHRHRLALPEQILKLSAELTKEKKEKEELEEELRVTRYGWERTCQQLKVSKAVVGSTLKRLEDQKVLAQEHAAKYLKVALQMQTLQETRNFHAETGLMSKVDSEWSIEELKAVLESLVKRLEYLIPEHTQPSMTQIAALYILKEDNPPKSHLTDTIEALNQELMQL